MNNVQKAFLAAFFLVLIAGIFLRVSNLNYETLGYGEVEVYQSASEFLKGNFVNNFYIFAETPLLKYIFALSLLSSLPPEAALRIVSAIFGILTIIIVFLFTKKLYNIQTALIASLLTSLSLIHVQFSRYTQFEAALSFFYVAVFYALWKFIEERNNKNSILLGVVIGLGILIKTVFLNALITIILFALMYKIITVKIRPSFSLTIDNGFIKAIIAAILAFFLVWPIALVPLHTNLTIDVQGRVNQVSANVPTLFLVFGYRFTEISKAVTDNIFLSIPLIGYLFFFIVKENIIFVALFFIGLLATYRNFNKKQDTFVLFVIALFFILIWLQNVRYTYRYITIIIPFLSIVAARSIYFLGHSVKNKNNKKINKKFWIFFVLVFIAMFFIAYIQSPDYPLYYNEFQNVFNLPDSEGRFSEGMAMVISNIKDCKSVEANNFYKFMIQPYYPEMISYNATFADCAITSSAFGIPNDKVDEYIQNNSCKLNTTIAERGVKLFEIYGC